MQVWLSYSAGRTRKDASVATHTSITSNWTRCELKGDDLACLSRCTAGNHIFTFSVACTACERPGAARTTFPLCGPLQRSDVYLWRHFERILQRPLALQPRSESPSKSLYSFFVWRSELTGILCIWLAVFSKIKVLFYYVWNSGTRNSLENNAQFA